MPTTTDGGKTWVYTEEELRRERRCVYHKVCACDHSVCRDGWLDDEIADPQPGDPNHTRVQRCPHCFDAALMTVEQNDTRGKGGWSRGR